MERKFAALIPVAVLAMALSLVQLPYFSEGPGPAQSVEALMTIRGHEVFTSRGQLVLTTVDLSSSELTASGLVQAWLDPNQTVIPESFILAPGETQQHANVRAISDMDQSKIDATVDVLTRLAGYPKRHGSGALVEGVASGCPADGRLFPGDLIASVNGNPVPDVRSFSRMLDAVPPGRPEQLGVEVQGKRLSVSISRSRCDGSKRALIGIEAVDNFPFTVDISSGDIGGPSAGLMWALGLYDLLTPGDLTRGRIVAGTGTIDPNGVVGPIGGVRDKIAAARSEGATVFLVPECNFEFAKPAAGGLTLVPVRNFNDALRYLERGVVPPVNCKQPVIG